MSDTTPSSLVITRGKEILWSLYEKYKNESFILDKKEINKKRKWAAFWVHTKKGIWAYFDRREILDGSFGFNSGLVFIKTESGEYEIVQLIYQGTQGDSTPTINLQAYTIEKLEEFLENDEINLKGEEVKFINDLITKSRDEITKSREKARKIREEKGVKLKKVKSNVLFDLDKDGNGEVDDVEGNDFKFLLKKHQKKILEIDRDSIKKFVKIASYLKDKKENVQNVFNSIKDIQNETDLNEYVGILKNEINVYRSILVNGISMLVSLIEDDVITYEEIYESMDRVNIFDSQWEKDLSQKLTNIGEGLNDLMHQIDVSNRRIIDELSNLTYATEAGYSELNSSISSELKSIDSSIKFNNLMTTVQTYQMYKVNKQTKGLID